MMTEGWNGKSVREHVEKAKATASDALQLAEASQAELMNLFIAVRMLAGWFGPEEETTIANILDDCQDHGAGE